MNPAERPPDDVDPQSLRVAFHALVRRFGLLQPDRTPCGQPLPVSHAHALMELLARPGVRQGELAAALGLSKSAMSRMADQLQRRGWIERLIDADDGRVRRPSLTTRGRRLARRIDQASIDRFEAMLDGIPEASRAQVAASLELLRQSVTGLPGASPANKDSKR